MLGIGRGRRRSPRPSSQIEAPTLPTSLPATKEPLSEIPQSIIDENLEYLLDLTKHVSTKRQDVSRKEISEEFQNFTGNSLEKVAMALGFTSEEEILNKNTIPPVRQVKNPPTKPVARQLRDSEPNAAKNNMDAKSICIPLFKGEHVIVRVDSETCWIPINLLSKIYSFTKAAIKSHCPHGGTGALEDYICYDCLHSFGEQFHQNLGAGSKIAVLNLHKLLANNFRNQNGYELCPSSAVE